MVAYGFKSSFVDDIRSGVKTQTIRRPRKRHARSGEHIQLYWDMRTKHCAKIIPDPLCVGIDDVVIDLRGVYPPQVLIVVNGIPLDARTREAEEYARSDGFGGLEHLGMSPAYHMMRWWRLTHGPILFEGVAIRWEASP